MPPVIDEPGEMGETGDIGPIQINNPEVLESPVEIIEVVPETQSQTDTEFGADFPGLVEAPLLSEDPLLEDPVASGGDSTLYAQDESGDESEEEDGEE